MTWSRWTRWFACAACLLGTGCTSLREIPRSDYSAQPERRNVRVHTREGLEYEFDFARVEGDTLVGFRRQDVEGTFEDYASVRFALDDIDHLSNRSVDWYRTGLLGGGVLAAIVAAGLNASSRDGGDAPTSGGGKPYVP